MARNIRRTGGLDMFEAIIGHLQASANACLTQAAIANGTTAGKLKTVTDPVHFRIDGALYKVAATDDAWALGAIPTLAANTYRAVTLYVDAAGAFTIDTGTIVTNTVSAAAGRLAALALCPAIPAGKSIVGVFVGAPSTNFANALTGQANVQLYHGIPAGYGTLSMVPLTPSGVADFPSLVAP